MKKCNKCQQIKPHDDFHADNSTNDGLHTICKDCKRAYRKTTYEKMNEKMRERRASAVEPVDLPALKLCAICGEEKPRKMFQRSKQRSDWSLPHCKACEKDRRLKTAAESQSRGIPQEKKCTRCARFLPASMFAVDRKKHSGMTSWCKDCTRDYNALNKERDQKNRIARRERLKARQQIDTPNEKRCYRCREIKPYHAFSLDRGRIDGLCPACKSCARECYIENFDRRSSRNKSYRQANREWLLKKSREWRSLPENRERARQTTQQWREDNPDRAKEAARSWFTRNRDKHRAAGHRRRARIAGNGGHFTDKDIRNMIYIQKGKCAYCGRAGYPLQIEHIVPIVRGGPSDPWNLCLACQRCNSSKNDKLLEEWIDRWYLR